MKLKSFLSIIAICQFSGCGVYEAQVNDSIEVQNQGIENRVTSLENKIDALKQELNQLEMMIQSQARDKSEQKLKSNNSGNAKESFESSFELLRKGDYVSAEIALREYIKDFPMGSYTDDAKYWLAESLFSQDKFSEALDIFNEIIVEYPGSEKDDGVNSQIRIFISGIGRSIIRRGHIYESHKGLSQFFRIQSC